MRNFKVTKSITNRADNLDTYLQEIGKIELIDVFEEIELAQKIKQWDKAALDKLVKANLRFVVSVAKQYQNQWLSLQDLVNEWNLWLIKAAERFDETRGFKFISYAVWRIRQSILHAIANKSKMVRWPLNIREQWRKIANFQENFTQEHWYQPTYEQIATFLGIPEWEIEDTISKNQKHVSLESSFDDDTPILGDILENNNFPNPDQWLMDESRALDIIQALNTLQPREIQIIELSFWLNGNKEHSFEEIWKILDLTRERVRQLREKALRRLKHTNRSKHLKQHLGK